MLPGIITILIHVCAANESTKSNVRMKSVGYLGRLFIQRSERQTSQTKEGNQNGDNNFFEYNEKREWIQGM